MTNDIAIKVEAISKCYRLKNKSRTIQELSKSLFKNNSQDKALFWALNDISFELAKGEILGIIGKNGAGKSTLLKILAQITPPSQGQITIEGKVSALLELGTGFHPDLSGRENVFLNGSLLGMSRKEVKAKFDEITAFAEIGRFIDEPVKHYSSGMYIRLAFSVAIFLNTNILILDEVLSVGDSSFQQKCIDKILDLKNSQKTILLVSHNLTFVRNLAHRVIMLDKGKIVEQGDPDIVISKYLQLYSNSFQQTWDLRKLPRSEQQVSRLLFTELVFDKSVYTPSDSIEFRLKMEQQAPGEFDNLLFGIDIHDSFGNTIYHLSNLFLNINNITHQDSQTYVFALPKLQLKPGKYNVCLYINADEEIQDLISSGVVLQVQEGSIYDFNKPQLIKSMVQPDYQFYIQ